MPAWSAIAPLEVIEGEGEEEDPGDDVALYADAVEESASCGLYLSKTALAASSSKVGGWRE